MNESQNTAEFRFYEELNDFLPPEIRKRTFVYSFKGCPAIKDVVEAIGTPHTEIDLLIVNGISVDFTYHLQNKDRCAVYPVWESIDISPIVRLREKPLRNSRFILDVHLGKLARLLRMFGFDALYDNHYTDTRIIATGVSEHRIILTRDKGILKNRLVTHGYWVHSTNPEKQIIEVINRFSLRNSIKQFSICMSCNGLISKVEKSEIEHLLPQQVKKFYSKFHQCSQCGKIYWQGSHYKNMVEKSEWLLSQLNTYRSEK